MDSLKNFWTTLIERFNSFGGPPITPEERQERLDLALEEQEKRNAELNTRLANAKSEAARRKELKEARLKERKVRAELRLYGVGFWSTKRVVIALAAVGLLILLFKGC